MVLYPGSLAGKALPGRLRQPRSTRPAKELRTRLDESMHIWPPTHQSSNLDRHGRGMIPNQPTRQFEKVLSMPIDIWVFIRSGARSSATSEIHDELDEFARAFDAIRTTMDMNLVGL
ncbi:hypothetical protein E4U09_003437 [Claviceps aff. purpurea]|uniref:Uncharacterized protein n=1 Tax=Claviceps aff. purpurea TaxID=1967640 RepID=A0A9P7QH40_9HYPO|nr:hypothetical protein E4U09_003437 [Claviceps aff. purpurea]